MREYYPLLLVGAVVGFFTLVFTLAYIFMKDKKKAIGFDRNMKDSEIIRRLLHYAKPFRRSFLFVFLIMMVSIAYDILSPYLVGQAEEMVKENFPMSSLLRIVGLYASILVVSSVCTYIQAVVLQKIGQKIVSNIREDLFTHIESLSHDQFHHIPVGKLVTRVTNDTNAISQMFTSIIISLAKNILVIIGVVTTMLLLNFELTLMILCFVPFIVLFTVIFRKFSRQAYRRVKDGTTDINTFLSENLSGMKITQIFNCEEKKLREFRVKNQYLSQAKHQQIFVFSIFRPIVYMLYISSVLCLLYLGGKGYIQNTSFMGQVITSGTLVSFYMYISKFFNPIQTLAEQFNWLQSAFASAEKIFSVMDMVPEVVDEPDAIELETIRGEIEFKDVWFAYESEDWVLKGVSFHILPKETVAFVGSTGSGKTTILSLLCRNYDIQKGQILVDGIDIRHIKLSCLRSHFGQMLQDVFLFSGTIKSNIVLRNEEYTDEEIMAACHYVNADHFINQLPDGLYEEVRERGRSAAIVIFRPDNHP